MISLAEFDTLQLTLLGIGLIATLVLFLYYLYFFTGFKKLKKRSFSSSNEPVSVVIAARNELKNLQKNLPLIFEQEYTDFEVVVVNDWSFDGTQDYLEDLAKTETRLRVVKVELDERFQRGKKFALTMGIKAAKNNRLILTDADCAPASKNWINSLVHHSSLNNIVLGYGPLKVKNTPLGGLIFYETFHTAIQYIGYAVKGKPYMGVGRNLSYTKDLFFAQKGFAKHQHIMSGDDDLFIQQAANSKNTTVNVDSDSFMISPAPNGLGAWMKQKIRHLSTGNEYRFSLKALLGFYSLAQLTLYIVVTSFVILFPHLWTYGLGLLVFKWLVQWAIMFSPAKILKANKVAYFLPYYDILYTLYLMIFVFVKPFIKPKTWN